MKLMKRTLILALVACLSSCSGARTAPSSSPTGSTLADRLSRGPWPEPVKVPAPRLSTETRPLPHDIAQLKRASGVRIAPDGSRVAYVLGAWTYDPAAEPDGDDDRSGGWEARQQLYVVSREGGEPRQLTVGEDAVSAPEFSPDGLEISFMRHHGKGRALHIMPLDGGEPRVLDLGELVPFAYEWAPDGKSIAFTAELPRSSESKLARFRSGGARVYEGEWTPVHLFVATLDGEEPRRVAHGDGSVTSFRWSPDGERFAVTTAPSSDPYRTMLFEKASVISAETGERIRELETEPTTIRALSWSPDGRFVAYQKNRGGLLLMNELRVHDLESGRSFDAAERIDPTLMGFSWAADSASIVALSYERTGAKLYRLARDGSAASHLNVGERFVVGGMETDESGRFLGTLTSTPYEPPNPTLIDLERSTTEVLASVNPQLSEWTMGEAEVVRWQNAEGQEIEGVLLVTPHAREGTPPPLMVMPHGGPDWVSSNGFHSWAHYFAARGYSVLRPNYRGGLAYGREFYAANRGRLGEIELADIESGVDHLVETGKADPERLYYGGWSWGGYLTAWTISHTERYRASVVGAGVVDVVLQYATSDVNHEIVADWEYLGRPWSHPEHFDRSNPARFLMNARTPTLIIHGEHDSRVAFANGQVLYRALLDVGCEVRFLTYPGEPHGFRQPAHIVHMLTEWAAWYDAHNGSPAAAAE